MKMLSIAAAFVALAGCSPAGSTTWYVDYANGRDTADGRTPATSWKHAPGDVAATGRPASQALNPGDKVQFRGGVSYRGAIRLAADGTAEKPILFTGLGWGEGMGVMDGGDAVTAARACESAADCGGASGWNKLSRIEFAVPPTKRIVLFGAKGLYFQSQIPILPDPFFNDDRQSFQEIPDSQLPALRSGQLRQPELAKAAADGGLVELVFWVKGNEVVRRLVLGVQGDVLRFDPTGVIFQDRRPNAVALAGSFAGLNAPGRYLVLRPGVIVANLRPEDSAATLTIGNGRNAFDLQNRRYVTISGLHFRNFAGARAARREGVPIGSWRAGAEGIEISGNLIGPGLLEHGQGVVQVMGTNGLRLKANRIENVMLASGLRTAGVNRNLLVEGNVIRRVGRTGITLFSVDRAEVRGNIVADIRGVHGNAITAYLANRDVLIEGNCVVMSSRPLTFHGNREPGVRNGITIRRNILVTDPNGQGGLISWGAGTTDVRIEGNVIAGPKMGLRVHESDRRVQVIGNDVTRMVLPDPIPSDWTVTGNTETLTLAAALKGEFNEEGCSVPASRLGLKLTRAGL